MTLPTEHEEQKTLITWAEAQIGRHPELLLLHAIPNGAFFGGEMKKLKNGKSVAVSAIRARKMKAEGVKPGVPDLHLPVPRGPHRSLYLEMKRQKGGKLSEEQVWWRDALLAQGNHVQRVDGFEQARTHLLAYLALPAPPDLPAFTLRPLSPTKKPAAPGRLAKPLPSKARITTPRPRPILYPGKP